MGDDVDTVTSRVIEVPGSGATRTGTANWVRKPFPQAPLGTFSEVFANAPPLVPLTRRCVSRSACGLGRYDRCFVATPQARTYVLRQSVVECVPPSEQPSRPQPAPSAGGVPVQGRERLDARPLRLLMHHCYLATRVSTVGYEVR
jgi:hypothetical protein